MKTDDAARLSKVLLAGLVGVLLLASSLTAGADGLTVGLILNTESAFDGYTLFTPIGEGNAYLIDNAGRPVHSWDKGSSGNLTPYLLEDGGVIRATPNLGRVLLRNIAAVFDAYLNVEAYRVGETDCFSANA